MTTKLFEIRDRSTFIAVMATKIDPSNAAEFYLTKRSGFSQNVNYVLMGGIDGGRNELTYDPYDWNNRTRKTAHEYIRDNFDTLESGEVIDVEFILGETKIKKVSESNDTTVIFFN